MLHHLSLYNQPLNHISETKKLISTINAHCYNVAKNDLQYTEALLNSHIVIPDGISVVWAVRWLNGQRLKKIAGVDLFYYEMNRLQQMGGRCFFLGSTFATLKRIRERINHEYPRVNVDIYSPPYKSEFSEKDNNAMIEAINAFKPNVLMIGMTAPKQEKWAYKHFHELQVGHICCIGAVFDFYSGNIHRAPKWMIASGFEWLYRLIKEPKRLWKRYLLGNLIFICYIIREKIKGKTINHFEMPLSI